MAIQEEPTGRFRLAYRLQRPATKRYVLTVCELKERLHVQEVSAVSLEEEDADVLGSLAGNIPKHGKVNQKFEG